MRGYRVKKTGGGIATANDCDKTEGCLKPILPSATHAAAHTGQGSTADHGDSTDEAADEDR